MNARKIPPIDPASEIQSDTFGYTQASRLHPVTIQAVTTILTVLEGGLLIDLMIFSLMGSRLMTKLTVKDMQRTNYG